jgi:hypothetical protein
MSPKIRLLALLAGLVLAACQTSPPWKGQQHAHSHIPATQPCDGASCDVNIDYEHDGYCDPSYCYPVAPVHVIVAAPTATAMDPPPVMMVWRLPSDSDATFSKNGIKFKEPKSGFDCQPGSPTDAEDTHAYHCSNKGLKPNQHDPDEEGWKYTIRLERPSGKGKLKPLDPWVVNR